MGLVRAACSNFSWRLRILVERDNSVAVTYLGSCKPFDLPLPDTLINKPERSRIDMPHEMCRKAANEDNQMGLKKGNNLQESVSWGAPNSHPSHTHMGCWREEETLLGLERVWAALTRQAPGWGQQLCRVSGCCPMGDPAQSLGCWS